MINWKNYSLGPTFKNCSSLSGFVGQIGEADALDDASRSSRCRPTPPRSPPRRQPCWRTGSASFPVSRGSPSPVLLRRWIPRILGWQVWLSCNDQLPVSKRPPTDPSTRPNGSGGFRKPAMSQNRRQLYRPGKRHDIMNNLFRADEYDTHFN